TKRRTAKQAAAAGLLAIAAIALNSPEARSEMIRVSPIGDSITAGYSGARLRNELEAIDPCFTVAPYALSGRTAQQFLQEGGVTFTLALSPDVVVVMLGTNDAAHSYSSSSWLDDYRSAMTQILDQLTLPNSGNDNPPSVILSTILPIVAPFPYHETAGP